ncbi:MAG: 23S rRNA pseudouridine(1911/1915/1917) synthase RluD [Coxiellaceae bacterium]|nr:23S rRNA pseudouridine(1911/1915/1917) synthase RluD [Coxiellaceae bacterium]
MTTFKQIITFDESAVDQRLDQALAAALPQFSREQIKGWIKQGKVTDSKKGTLRPRDKVTLDQTITIEVEMEQTNSWQAEPLELDIVYEDDDLIVVNKPAGLIVHPGAGVKTTTLINGLLAYCPALAEVPRCGVVHRIDKDTTGLLVVAKSQLAHNSLSEQLQTRSMSRKYEAVVKGTLVAGGKIDAPIDRHPKHRTKMAVHPTGREAVTHYRVLDRFNYYTHISASLESGRTHQIRVHFDSIHHPLVGDPTYGTHTKPPAAKSDALHECLKHFKRQALHAKSLQLEHPRTGETMQWEIPLPQDMIDLLAALQIEQDTIERI